jgi:hypothetical protein
MPRWPSATRPGRRVHDRIGLLAHAGERSVFVIGHTFTGIACTETFQFGRQFHTQELLDIHSSEDHAFAQQAGLQIPDFNAAVLPAPASGKPRID